MRLTAKERILLYLLEVSPRAETVDVSPDLTQDGIVRGAGIDLRHVPQYVRPLMKDGWVEERQAHVRGVRQRRKVYHLTEAGRMAALRLRERVRAETVRVRDGANVREVAASDALREAGGTASLLDLVRQVQEGGVVDLARLVPTRAGAFVEMLAAAPRIGTFRGRGREIEILTQDGGGPRVFVVRGVAGIGKSSLGAKACEALRGERNLYWHRVRTWDTSRSVLSGLGEFLGALGRPGLRSVLGRGEPERAAEVLRNDLPGTRSFLVYDDVHEASGETLAAFRALKDAIAEAEDVRALIFTRRSVRFYDRRDVSIRHLVQEMDLKGLDAADAAALLTAEGRGPHVAKVARQFGGHPLFLELLRSSGPSSGTLPRTTSVERFIEEEIYGELSPPERRMMKLAALYRTPVPREALFQGPDLTYDVLLSLQDRALLRSVGDGTFEAHDTIRGYFESILSGREAATLRSFAIGQLRALASAAEARGDFLACVDGLSNALALGAKGKERIALLEALGDASQRIGDLPQTLNAFKEGMAEAKDPELIARLHRKVAEALCIRGEFAAAEKEAEEGIRALGASRSVERGWLDLVRGTVAEAEWAKWDRDLAYDRAALEVFREHGERRGECIAVRSIAEVLMHAPAGDLEEGEKLLQTQLQLATSLDDSGLISEGHGTLAHFYLFHRPDIDRAMRHLAAEESTSRDQGYFTRSFVLWWKALAQLEFLADYAGAEANLNEVIALARRTYDPEGGYLARYQLAMVAYLRGDIPEARRRHEALWRESAENGWFEFKWAIQSLWLAAECCLLEGDRGGFERLAAELGGPGVQERITDRMVVAELLRGLAGFVRRDGETFESSFSRARAAAERSLRTQEAPYQHLSFLVPRYYGLALRAQGRDVEAAPFLTRALDILQQYRLRAHHDSLVRDEDRIVEVLRAWSSQGAA